MTWLDYAGVFVLGMIVAAAIWKVLDWLTWRGSSR